LYTLAWFSTILYVSRKIPSSADINSLAKKYINNNLSLPGQKKGLCPNI
jgi:hypothetical protein